jgi:hypothetical protein
MGHVMAFSSTRKHPRFAVTIGGTAGLSDGVGATADTAMVFEGELLTRILLECYENNNGRTTTFTILDENGCQIYTAAGNATGAAGNCWAPTGGIELDGDYTIRLLHSGAGATAGIDYVTLFVR